MIPEDWRELAKQAKAEAIELARAGRLPEAAHKSVDAQRFAATADQLEGLTTSNQSGNIPRVLTERESLRRSKSRPARSRLVEAANAAGWSLRALAEELGEGASHTILSQAADGERRIRETHADRIQVLLGKDEKGKWRWPATRQSWPKGFVDLDAKKK